MYSADLHLLEHVGVLGDRLVDAGEVVEDEVLLEVGNLEGAIMYLIQG